MEDDDDKEEEEEAKNDTTEGPSTANRASPLTPVSLDAAGSPGGQGQLPRSKYHAIRVECSFAACEAAQALQGKPFLSLQAPALPLSECDHSNCKCHFSHHQDRRSDDRRGPYTTALEGVVLANQSDRRHRIDRRQAVT